MDADVAILCGGLGTRLGSLSKTCPKPMLKIGMRPFLEILIEQAASFGFDRIILCLGYLGPVIQDYFKNYHRLKLEFSMESRALGTAGGLKNAERYFRKKWILVMNGDSYCPVDLKALVQFHQGHDGIASMVVVPADQNRRDSGYITVNAQNQVVDFREKQYQAGCSINAGIYIFDASFLRFIPQLPPSSLECDILPNSYQEKIYAKFVDTKLYDIGTPERLEQFRQYARRHLTV